MIAEYIGCFKIRNVADDRQTMRTERWYDPHHMVFVGDDSRYAEGPFYALAAPIISGILRSGLSPRLGGPEGEDFLGFTDCRLFPIRSPGLSLLTKPLKGIDHPNAVSQ